MTLSSFAMPHLIAGSAALLLFWIAVFKRKGTAIHRKIGQAYLACMSIVVLTGIPLTLHLFLTGHTITAVFLGYLVILVSLACVNSVRAIRYKRDRAGYYGLGHRLAVGVLAAAGIAVMVVGWNSGAAAILIPFGALGPWNLFVLIRDLGKRDVAPNWWLKEHYGAMIGNGIATHIAFSQIGLSRLLPGQSDLVAMLGWLLPLGIGLTAIVMLDRRYRRPAVRIPAPSSAPSH
ncbi:hypothetical protein [Wenzhouxiangella marina]|uniref:Uncharacterized protein n=1 Tax=Wenzhouxiangella marina TaxID=1579979 RepID=A0A0K0XWG3_9GAMM|nr:hypothetical protein [Wenzhouxiangella marina]AKS42010.1 hypothetical protein WM2015_1640 [Wenzhouxiangella marina]MBB6086222.1 putative membrane protein [Wenzhouxiangella marina]